MTAEVVTAEAQAKIDAAENTPEKEPTDDYFRTAEWYREASLPIPKNLSEAEDAWIKRQESGGISLDDSDFEFISRDVYVRPKLIDFMVDDADTGCTVFLKSGQILPVAETSRVVYNRIRAHKTSKKLNKSLNK